MQNDKTEINDKQKEEMTHKESSNSNNLQLISYTGPLSWFSTMNNQRRYPLITANLGLTYTVPGPDEIARITKDAFNAYFKI
jgi:hypothetical protein